MAMQPMVGSADAENLLFLARAEMTPELGSPF